MYKKNLTVIFLITLMAVMGVASITPAFPQIIRLLRVLNVVHVFATACITDNNEPKFGLAAWNDSVRESQELLRVADTALLAAESAGGGVEFG